jgi:hypothetical protein
MLILEWWKTPSHPEISYGLGDLAHINQPLDKFLEEFSKKKMKTVPNFE